METHTILAIKLSLQSAVPHTVLQLDGDPVGLLGHSAKAFLGGEVALPSLIHQDDRDVFESMLTCPPGQEPQLCNIRMRQSNGRIRCLVADYARLPCEAGATSVLQLRLQDAKGLFRHQDELVSNTSFRAMLENTHDFIFFKNQHHVFTSASQTLVDITLSTRHWTDLVGQTDYDVFPEAYADIYYRLEKQVFAGIDVAQENQAYETNRGVQGWVDNRKYPIKDEYGRIIGLFGMARIITDKLLAEQALRQEHETLQLILDCAPIGIWLQNGKGKISFVNKAFCQATGITEAQFLAADHYMDLLPEAYRPQCLASDEKALASDGVSVTLQQLPFVDGKVHDLRIIKATRRDALHQVKAMVGLSLDVTEEMRQTQALRMERDTTGNILDTVEAMIMAMDTHGRITLINRKGCEILGYPEDELIGKDWFATCLPKHLDTRRLREVFHMALHGPQDEFEYFENPVLTRGGNERLMAWHNSIIRDKNNSIIGWLSAGEDITSRKNAEDKLLESKQLLRAVIDEIPDPVVLKDRHGNFLLCNQAVARLYNTTPAAMVGKHDGDFGVPKDMADFFRNNVLAIMAKGETEIVYEKSRNDVTGQVYHYRSIKKPYKNAQGENQILVVAQNITDLIDTQEQVADRERILQQVLAITNEGVWDWHIPSGRVVHNAQWFKLLGSNPEGVPETVDAFTNMIHPEDRELVHQRLGAVLEGRMDQYQSQHRLIRNDGRPIWVIDRGRVVERDPQGKAVRVIGSFTDVTYQVEHQRQLEYIAHYDTLTRLPNRILLADRLQQAMVLAQRQSQMLAVAYIDLDGFKTINDAHGHDAGDRLLSTLASRMKIVLREGDTLARLGGDEFVAVMSGLTDVASCLPMLTRLLAAAAESVDDHGTLLQVSASLGVTVFPQLEGVEADQLLRQSDQAMYQAKLSGKNRYHIFDAEHDRSLRGHHEGLERVRTALIKDEFVLYYQPKVNMRTGTVIGAEALIRWQHPVRGLLAPAAFLPLVADHPLSITLGEWVLNSAMAQVEAWKTEGLQMPVSVNIDANHLQSPDFVTQLRQLLEHHPGVARGDLELEVLETSALEDMGHVAAVILACKDMGVGFALDDFGTGYSSLTYLKRLPAGLLKIDQSFVRDMMDDPDDLAILEGVLGLARAFRCQAIAEGVESVANGQMLLRLGCELAQGYAIARPMPAAAMPGWLATWKTDASWLNQAQVRLDDRHILFASVEHRAWIAQVARYVHGEPNCTAVPSHQPCRFSEWLEQNRHLLQAAYATLPAVELLLAVVHTRANDLMRLKEQGHATEAIARLGDLYALRDQLFEQLQAMLD